MIHNARDEITLNIDEGSIKIKDELILKLADKLSVVIHQVKIENHSIIVKIGENK